MLLEAISRIRASKINTQSPALVILSVAKNDKGGALGASTRQWYFWDSL
jgi:hypothetical protein